MTAVVKVTVLPQGHPPVQLSSMTMVHTVSYTHRSHNLNYFFQNVIPISTIQCSETKKNKDDFLSF